MIHTGLHMLQSLHVFVLSTFAILLPLNTSHRMRRLRTAATFKQTNVAVGREKIFRVCWPRRFDCTAFAVTPLHIWI